MNHPAHVALARRLFDDLERPIPRPLTAGPLAVHELSMERYLSPARFESERALIFGRAPSLVAHADELEGVGAMLPVQVGGIPLVVTRGEDGRVRAFRNACRHRGTELVRAPCRQKAFVCPYHAWTYDLEGTLIHVPHESVFVGRARDRSALVSAYAEERHGFIWASLGTTDVGAHLGALDEEVASFTSEKLTLYRRSVHEVRANWKLIVDAFLEGYHVQKLHRASVYPFFMDGRSAAEPVGDHVRTMTPRRTMSALKSARFDDVAVREFATPSYVLFPGAVVILHPDYISIATLAPVAADHTTFTHLMLVAAGPRSEKAEAHYAKSFSLIDEVLFAKEDLAAVEAVQRGLRASADKSLLLGDLEQGISWFHATVDRWLARG